MTYVYLNYYPNGYLYVGSHTWDGYGIDPNYIGSSGIACYHNWVPSQIEILETCSKEERYEREKYWINHFCKCYGVCEQVSNISSKFASQFKKGLLLNCHSNSMEHCHSPEATAKWQKLQRENGHLAYFTECGHTPEAEAKSFETRKANGSFKKCCDAGNSPEARKKANESIRKTEWAFGDASQMNKNPDVVARRAKTYSENHARRVIDQYGNVYKSGTDIGREYVAKAFKLGEYAPQLGKWKGYIFKPYVKNQENN